MTNLERVCLAYDLVLALVVSDKKVTVKTKYYSVDFWKKNDTYHMHAEKVVAHSEYLHPLYELVRSTIADKALCEDIEIMVDNELFAILKN